MRKKDEYIPVRSIAKVLTRCALNLLVSKTAAKNDEIT